MADEAAIGALREQHPDFAGDWEDLRRLAEAAATPTHCQERGDAVRAWNAYNTERKDWDVLPDGQYVKTALQHHYRGVDLRRASFRPLCLGHVDLRGADLREASLPNAMLKSALLYRADLSDVDLADAYLERASFADATLARATLTGAWLANADLTRADLRDARLGGACLADADLANADLRGARLDGASLERASLWRADLRGATLRGADLRGASLVECDLRGADLTGSHVYGISAWDVKLDDDDRLQRDLVITPDGSPEATVDRVNVAQFYYLMLENRSLRDVIRTVGQRGVLLLGRFTPERKTVLDALRDGLRAHGYLPMMFDFERPLDQPLTDTVVTLAGLSRFVIADLTRPASVPHEIAQVTAALTVPVAPILEQGADAYAMFDDYFVRFPERVLQVLTYRSREELLGALDAGIIARAEDCCRRLEARTREPPRTLSAGDFTAPAG